MLLVINRGLRKSGGKGKKYDKEAMRASLDSRYLHTLYLLMMMKTPNVYLFCFVTHLLELAMTMFTGFYSLGHFYGSYLKASHYN